VQHAQVTAVRDATVRSAQPSGQSRRVLAVSVRLDNRETRTCEIEPDAHLQIGDRVIVTTSGGITRITRQ